MASRSLAKHVDPDESLIAGHLRIVSQIVNRTVGRVPNHVSREELLAAGQAGLVMAARSYDPRRGVPFEHYAARRVRGAVLDELRSTDWASRPVRTAARLLAATTEDLTHRLGRHPTTRERARAAGLTEQGLSHLERDVARAQVVNYEPTAPDGGMPGELAAPSGDPESHVLEHEQMSCLGAAIAALPQRLERVVKGYFFEERPVASLAAELGVSESRVSQLRNEALELLRGGLNARLDPAQPRSVRGSSGRTARRSSACRTAREVVAV